MRISSPLLILCCVAYAKAQQPATFHDPSGRFTMQLPAGWKSVQMNADAVQWSSGAAYVTALVLPGNDADLMVKAVGQQTAKQWKGFAEASGGPMQLAGREGRYATYRGTNPMGTEAYLELMAVNHEGNTYLLMISAPVAEFGRLKTAFDQMEKSFTLTMPSASGAPVHDEPPPIPSGAGTAHRPATPPQPSQPFAPPATTKAAPGNPGYYRMKKATLVDERGFERPMPAMSILIPSDWRFQGGVQYAKAAGCSANLAQLAFRAVSPDGQMALELIPGNTWQWSDDPNTVQMLRTSNQQQARYGRKGCDIMPPMTAGEYVRRTVVPSARAQARLTGVEPMPEVAQEVGQKAQQAQAAAQQAGMQTRVRADVGRARLAYTIDGQPAEEWMLAITYASAMQAPTYNMRTGRMGQTVSYTCAAEGVYAFRAPAGQLDSREKLFMAMLSTVHVSAQWQNRVMQVVANMNAADAKGAADRTKIIAQSGQDTSKIIHDTYENTSKARDRAAEGFSQYLRGVETYRNPNTGETVELSNQYGHAWAGNNGEYILSDSANFNPNVDLRGGNWTQLEQVRR
jgi:hypothetical protein